MLTVIPVRWSEAGAWRVRTKVTASGSAAASAALPGENHSGEALLRVLASQATAHQPAARDQSRASARTGAGLEASAPTRAELPTTGSRVIRIRFKPENPETQIILQVSFSPERECLVSAAQIVKLMYRRLLIGRALAVLKLSGEGAVPQD